MSLHRTWAGVGLSAALLLLSTGCTDKVKSERDSLLTQNKQLAQTLAEKQQTLDQKDAELSATKAALAETQAQPKTTPDALSGGDFTGGPAGGAGSRRTSRTTVRGGSGATHVTAASRQRFEIAGDVAFTSGRSALSAAAKAELKKLVPTLKRATSIRVEGHTDAVPMKHGSNEALSKARAEAVKAYLVGQGVPSRHITAVGMGSSHPKSTSNQALNRRVEIVVNG
jgi:outer membrane protein OmpA-like peptidoglycan-associated protein